MPRLCEFYSDICLTTEEKTRKNLCHGKKNYSQFKKNFVQSTVYILPKHPHITKPSKTHTLQNPHIHTHTHTHTLKTHTHNMEKYDTVGQATDDNMAHALCMLDT